MHSKRSGRALLVLLGVGLLVSPFTLYAGRGAAVLECIPLDMQRRCGLDKLTPAELALLKEQLDLVLEPQPQSTVSSDVSADLDTPRGEAAFGREEEIKAKVELRQEIPDSIRSRIRGDFRGWSGETVFRLENGQVWRQIGSGSAYIHLDSPGVTIERGAMGAFFLRVEGLSGRIKVRRVK